MRAMQSKPLATGRVPARVDLVEDAVAERDIGDWLSGLGLVKYATQFRAQDISPDLIPDLTDADLRELGVVSLGDRKRLRKAAGTQASLAGSLLGTESMVPGASATPTDLPQEEGERRQATVMPRPLGIHGAERSV